MINFIFDELKEFANAVMEFSKAPLALPLTLLLVGLFIFLFGTIVRGVYKNRTVRNISYVFGTIFCCYSFSHLSVGGLNDRCKKTCQPKQKTERSGG